MIEPSSAASMMTTPTTTLATDLPSSIAAVGIGEARNSGAKPADFSRCSDSVV